MNLPPFTGPGATQTRLDFWEQARAAVLASQKIAGRFVTVSEHPGKGTVVNISDTSSRRPGGGGGATGACCVGTDCSITTEAACVEAGGTYQGDDTVCDPNPCITLPCCCPFYFNAFDGSGRKFLTLTQTTSDGSDSLEAVSGCSPDRCFWEITSVNVSVSIIDAVTCAETAECSGTVDIECAGIPASLTNEDLGGYCGCTGGGSVPNWADNLCGLACDIYSFGNDTYPSPTEHHYDIVGTRSGVVGHGSEILSNECVDC